MRSKEFLRCPVTKALHRSAVQLPLQRFDEMFRISRDIAPLGDISSDGLVGILHRAFLPTVVRMAEIYLHAKEACKLLMFREQNIIVHRECSRLRKSRLDLQEGDMHVRDGRMNDPFDEQGTAGALDDDQQNAAPRSARDDEIGFGVADPATRIDILRSLVNEGAIENPGSSGTPGGSPFPALSSMPLNTSSLDASDEAVNRVLGYGGQDSMPPDMPRDGFR